MRKRELATRVATRLKLPERSVVAPVIQGIIAEIRAELIAGRSIRLDGFLSLEPTVRRAFRGHAPRNGSPVDVPERPDVRVAVSREITGAMLPPDQWPKPRRQSKRTHWWERSQTPAD